MDLNWLNEILQVEDAGMGIGHDDVERMAHVIRELAEVARFFRNGKRAAVYDAIANLSRDAKDVL